MRYFKESEMKCKCCRQLPEEYKMNAYVLVDNVLDPVRAKFGKPIKVNSFYRCKKHNSEVGGSPRSQHLVAEAADVAAEAKGYANMEAWKQANMEIAGLIIKNGKFDQLILENVGEKDLLPTWVHVSYSRKLNRGQILKKVAGKAGYAVVTAEEICKLLGSGFKKA